MAFRPAQVVKSTSRVYRWTLLHRCAHQGNTKAVKLLLKRGANVLAKDREGRVALHLAAIRGFNDTVKALQPPTDKALKALGVKGSEPALALADARGLTVSQAFESTARHRQPQKYTEVGGVHDPSEPSGGV